MAGQPFTLFDVARRGMSAQMVRMNAASSNLANAGTVSATEGEAYRPIRAVFAEELDRRTGLSTVRVGGVVRSDVAPLKQHSPITRWPMPTATSGPPRSMRTPRWSRCSTPRASTRTWSRRFPPPSS